MSRITKIVVGIIIIVMLVIGTFLVYKNFNNKLNSYITISYDELYSKINSNEKFVLFIGSNDCSHCTKFKGTLNKIVKDYNVEIFYIDISTLTKVQYAYLNSHFPFSGTPTTIVIENGTEYKRQSCRIDGAKNYDYTVNRLKKAGII